MKASSTSSVSRNITVFTSDDLNSKLVLATLDARRIPYTEVYMRKFSTNKLSDLRRLSSTGVEYVPQMFIGSRCVGGVDSIVRELSAWDEHPEYSTAFEYYRGEVVGISSTQLENDVSSLLSFKDSSFATDDHHLQQVQLSGKFEAATLSPGVGDLPSSLNTRGGCIQGAATTSFAVRRQPIAACIELLDGTRTTYHDITDKLRHTIPIQSVLRRPGNATTYKKCFTGKAAIDAFEHSLDVSREDAVKFGNILLRGGVINSIYLPPALTLSTSSSDVRNNTLHDSDDAVYRLQCHSTPDMLNSYRIWPNPTKGNANNSVSEEVSVASQEPAQPSEEISSASFVPSSASSNNSTTSFTMPMGCDIRLACINLVDSLSTLLRGIELDSLTLKKDRVCHNKIKIDPRFPLFEEAICELQAIDISFLETGATKDDPTAAGQNLAFAINLYKLMLAYAMIKIGIPNTEADCIHFLRTMKFDLGGTVFSLQEWYDGVIRSNTKVTYSSTAPFHRMDGRRKYACGNKLDYRVHFATHVDPISHGSSCSLPFTQFTSSEMNDELDIAARVFCNCEDNVRIDTGKREVTLSKLFSWYRYDFGYRKVDLLKLLMKHLVGDKEASLKKLLSSSGGDVKLNFLDADWSKNIANHVNYHRSAAVGDVTSLKTLLTGRRFKAPEHTADENLRIFTLHGLNMLDSLPEERFDRITRMCKEEFNVPLCLVSLIDSDRQCFKSSQWDAEVPQISETDREMSFCGHAIFGGEGDVFIVEDASHDDRFADNPAVTGPLGVRFYAGAPLTVPASTDGLQETTATSQSEREVSIGTLCICDVRPRTLTNDESDKLCQFAKKVKDEILRRNEEEENDSLLSN